MATYNGEKYLRPQIESILTQSYENIELVVVDDASTDSTLSILKEFAVRDNRIYIYPAENNLGFIANFERGIRLAKGEFIALADQDDIFRSDKIEVLINTLKAYPERDLAVSDLSLVDENGNVLSESMWASQKRYPSTGHPFRRLVYANFATGCAMMIRRRLLDFALPFPPNCLVHDWWLAVVAASENAGGIYLVREALTSYRQHTSNIIGARKRAPLSIRKNLTIFFAPHRVRERLDVRNSDLMAQISRLNGYLFLDIWSSNDRLVIEKYKKVLQNYLADENSSFCKRLSCIPQRLYYSIQSRSMRRIAEVVYFSIFPFR